MCRAMEELYAEGKEEGRAEGMEQGREEQAQLTALNLHDQGLSIEQIARAIGFSKATVEQWLTPKAV